MTMIDPRPQTVEMCPDWCLQADVNSDGLRLAADDHSTAHHGYRTAPGQTLFGASVHVGLVAHRGPGCMPPEPIVELSVLQPGQSEHDTRGVSHLSPAVARALAAHLVHAADVAEGLRRP